MNYCFEDQIILQHNRFDDEVYIAGGMIRLLSTAKKIVQEEEKTE